MEPTDDEFRTSLRVVLARSGLSMRALSAAMGRDAGYVAALLDPSRPSRARPTPTDLLRASDATGIPFVELLATLLQRPGATRFVGPVPSAGSGDPRVRAPVVVHLPGRELSRPDARAALTAWQRSRCGP